MGHTFFVPMDASDRMTASKREEAEVAPKARVPVAASYSHSMVPGGFDVMS